MNVIKVGQKIAQAIERSHPLNLKGLPIAPAKKIFEHNNPYILEALPSYLINPEEIKLLSLFDGKPLNKVIRFLDKAGESSEKFVKTMERFFIKKSPVKSGISEIEMETLFKKAFPNIKIPYGINEDAFIYLNNLSRETGSQFDAHGIAKYTVADQLKQLNNLLTNGIDKSKLFYTAPLVAKTSGIGGGLGTAGGHAYRDGSFILVSGKGKNLIKDGIDHVIVNDAYYNIFDDLVAKFPHVKFVKANVASEYFEKIARN